MIVIIMSDGIRKFDSGLAKEPISNFITKKQNLKSYFCFQIIPNVLQIIVFILIVFYVY